MNKIFKMAAALALPAVIALNLAACQNISADEFGAEDLKNIIGYIFPATGTTAMPEDVTAPPETLTGVVTRTSTAEDMTTAADTPTTEPVTQPNTEPTRVDYSSFPELPARFRSVEMPEYISFSEERKEAIRLMDRLPEKDFEGREYKILTYSPPIFTPVADDNRVNEARYYRNALVEKQFNVNISSVTISDDSLFRTLERAINTGEHFADLMSIPMSLQYNLMINGMLMNLDKMPFMNLNAPYYNESLMKAASAGLPTYQFTSDFTSDYDEYRLIIYNKDIITELSLEDPYTYFKNGTWTMDRLLEYSKAAVRDVNGNNAYNDGDRVGLTLNTTDDDAYNMFMNAAGINYYVCFPEELPSMNYFYDRTEALFDMMKQFWNNGDKLAVYSNTDASMRNSMFFEYKALFHVAPAGYIKELPSEVMNFGLLPLPKLEAGQTKYSTYTFNEEMSASIPNNPPNSEFTGIVTEALCAGSYAHIRTEYLSDMMLHHLRNYNSVDVLRTVIDNASYDFAQLGASNATVYNASTGLVKSMVTGNGNFKTLYDRQYTTVTNYLTRNFK